MNQKINQRVKLLRKQLNLTQEQFALKIGVSRANIGNIEYNRVSLTERNIKLICDKFNVNEEWLKNGVEPIFKIQKETEKEFIDILKYIGIKPMVLEIIQNYLNMTDEKREIFDNYLKELVGIEKYDKSTKKSTNMINLLFKDKDEISKLEHSNEKDIVGINTEK